MKNKIAYLVAQGYDTAEKWVQIWKDPSHVEYNKLMKEMLNVSHLVHGKKPIYKWTYTPQTEWIMGTPKYVLLFEYIDDDLQYMMQKLGSSYRKGKKVNATYYNKNPEKLSSSSIEFLEKFYKSDFEIYEKYKNKSVEERIPF